MRGYKASSGFTLIEILIAMTLLGIMMVLLFSSMKICADSWQKGEDKIAQVNDVAVVYQFFQHHLSEAKPLWNDFSEDQDFSFKGKNQELQFVSAFPASAKKPGLQLFFLNLIQEGDEQLIQVAITPFYPVAEGEEWRKEEVTLLRHVTKFSINYFAYDDAQDEGVWQEDWLDQEALPRLVKISIELESGQYWPDMVFELKSVESLNDNEEDILNEDSDDEVDEAPLIEEQQ